jgi:hypothetical protein
MEPIPNRHNVVFPSLPLNLVVQQLRGGLKHNKSASKRGREHITKNS